jgi:hypothetical protein
MYCQVQSWLVNKRKKGVEGSTGNQQSFLLLGNTNLQSDTIYSSFCISLSADRLPLYIHHGCTNVISWRSSRKTKSHLLWLYQLLNRRCWFIFVYEVHRNLNNKEYKLLFFFGGGGCQRCLPMQINVEITQLSYTGRLRLQNDVSAYRSIDVFFVTNSPTRAPTSSPPNHQLSSLLIGCLGSYM